MHRRFAKSAELCFLHLMFTVSKAVLWFHDSYSPHVWKTVPKFGINALYCVPVCFKVEFEEYFMAVGPVPQFLAALDANHGWAGNFDVEASKRPPWSPARNQIFVLYVHMCSLFFNKSLSTNFIFYYYSSVQAWLLWWSPAALNSFVGSVQRVQLLFLPGSRKTFAPTKCTIMKCFSGAHAGQFSR